MRHFIAKFARTATTTSTRKDSNLTKIPTNCNEANLRPHGTPSSDVLLTAHLRSRLDYGPVNNVTELAAILLTPPPIRDPHRVAAMVQSNCGSVSHREEVLFHLQRFGQLDSIGLSSTIASSQLSFLPQEIASTTTGAVLIKRLNESSHTNQARLE